MINVLDQVLRDLVQSRILPLSGATQVGFEPPNDDWVASVNASGEERVNLYLYDARENVKLRSNARVREYDAGWSRLTPHPPRVDLHYAVTAWTAAEFVPGVVEPTLDEHLRLYQVLAVLMQHRPLRLSEVYGPGITIPSGRTITAVPLALRNFAELPVEVVPPDARPNQGDFWSTMHRAWRPALELVVTIPVLSEVEALAEPMVTTVISDFGFLNGMRIEDTETLASIGGRVRRTGTSAPVPRAWIQLVGTSAPVIAVVRRTRTDDEGRFTFTGLRPGQYRLTTVATGVGTMLRDVDLPSASGDYDLQLP